MDEVPTPTPRQGGRNPDGKPVSVTPSDRLAEMTQNLIGQLEQDKKDLQVDVIRLHAIVDRFGPENARLLEALSNAESNSVISTILVGVGGFLVSYASFMEKLAKTWANVAAGLLLAGILIMAWHSVRRWRRG